MQIISQGNNYIVQFDLYSDLTNIANNVIGNLTYNNTQLTLVSMTVTPTIGTQSTLNTNQYLFGTVLPNKHYAVACVFTLLQESNLIPITWTISTSNPETTLANNSKTINLVDYLDGLLASDICNNLKGCVVTTQVRFVEVLPNGEWSWENYNPITNTVVSTFTTPATSAQIITSTDSSVIVSGSDLSVTHTVNPDGSVTLNDGTIIPAPTPQLTPAEICASIAATCNATLGSFTPTVNPDGSTTYTATFTGNNGVPTDVTFTIPAAPSITVVSADADNDITVGTDGGAYFKETITEITGTQPTGKTIGTYINEAGAPTEIKESLVTFTPTAGGVQLVSEDGTVFPLIFEFNDTTPSAPLLDIKLNGTTVSSIPLNSYDVNITTTGGFVFNPLTDEIIITETNGEPHVIDLTPLRTTITSVDGSVEIVPSVNPDGSTNYDLTVGVPNAHIVATAPYDPLNPLTGWVAPSSPIAGNTVEVKFTDGTVANYTFDGTVWVLDFIARNKAVNNLQVVNEIVERGNVSLGGGQPADFTRNTYNWLGANFQDKWQSSGDANLFDIKANQTVNATNTTNSGSGAVNIGTSGANGQYKLNVGGAIWLNNGRNTTIIGNSAATSSTSSGAVIIGSQAAQNTIASDGNEVLIGFQVAQNSDCKFGSTVIGARSAKNATNLGGGLTIIGGDAANAANLFNTSNHTFIGSQCAARIKTQFSEGDIAIGVNSGSDFNGRGFTLIGSNVARFAQGVDVTYIGRESALNLVGNKNTITGSASANTTISGNNLSIFGAYSYQNAIGGDNSIFGHDNSVYVKNMSFSTILGASGLGDMGFNGTGSDGLKSVYETTIIGSSTGNTYKGNTLNKVISLGSQNFNSLNNTQDFTNMMFLGNNISEVPVSQTSNRTILGFNEVPVFDVTTANTTLPSPVLLGGRYMYQETETGVLRISGGTGKIAAIQGVYQNDADAASNGVQLGQCYELSSTNTYGMPEGILKTRKL